MPFILIIFGVVVLSFWLLRCAFTYGHRTRRMPSGEHQLLSSA